MTFKAISPVTVYNGIPSGGWHTADPLTQGIPHFEFPSDTSGYIIHFIKNSQPNTTFGLKSPGATEGYPEFVCAPCHLWGVVACDPITKRFEWNSSAASGTHQLDIVGYLTPPGITLFQNGVEITPAVKDSWQTVHLTALCPGAIGIFLEVSAAWGSFRFWGVRQYGSTDDRKPIPQGKAWPVIGCDSSQRIQCYSGNDGSGFARFYVKGYLSGRAAFNLNGHALGPSVGFYANLECQLPGGTPEIAFIEVGTNANIPYALRRSGDAEDYFYGYWHNWGMPGLAGGLAEGKVQTAGDPTMYLIGVGFGKSVPEAYGNLAARLVGQQAI
jgi:hypothetical protein